MFEAETDAAVSRLLEEKRLFPLSVRGAAEPAGHPAKLLARRVRSRDVGTMYGQLADLIGSGVPMLRALDSLIRSTVSPRLVSASEILML